jgi:NAD(P)-dependent dehydrogenase (short-subunit alcohol dehydrogenase family)
MGLEPAERKVALITGANKGIGLEIAHQLGRQGMTVLVGARAAGRGREAIERLRSEGIDAYLIRLDVTSQATIDQAARRIMVRWTAPPRLRPSMRRSAHFTTG